MPFNFYVSGFNEIDMLMVENTYNQNKNIKSIKNCLEFLNWNRQKKQRFYKAIQRKKIIVEKTIKIKTS